MNPDNPYASPQTIEASALVSVGEKQIPRSPRSRLAEWETARLMSLWQRSRAINDMQAIWLVACFAAPVVGYLCSLSFGLYEFSIDPTRGLIALGGVVLTFARFGLGFVRSRVVRPFAMLMDTLLGLGCIVAIAGSVGGAIKEPKSSLIDLYIVFVAALIGLLAGYSVRAMFTAPELYGPDRITHDALRDEVESRKKK